MTPDERFERIEELIQTILEADVRNRAALQIVLESQVRTQESLRVLNEPVSRSADAADARLRRIEENLDALIRAITSEHTNGKGNR
ncbi:MAG TPA: hypothetical protein VMH81_17785 [Bryobacteraceae bacterium]|nr:hypothetical protein [Bryobacteraceae bacterium]